jgi:hypothetical protein
MSSCTADSCVSGVPPASKSIGGIIDVPFAAAEVGLDADIIFAVSVVVSRNRMGIATSIVWQVLIPASEAVAGIVNLPVPSIRLYADVGLAITVIVTRSWFGSSTTNPGVNIIPTPEAVTGVVDIPLTAAEGDIVKSCV